jgi:RNA polymerase sigma factor (sigma-70 family)
VGGSPSCRPCGPGRKWEEKKSPNHFRARRIPQQPVEMMRELALTARLAHPLVADRARLDKIIDNMAAQIHRVIYGRGRDSRSERALHGGESADDVLQDALIALLGYDPGKLRTTWEALSVGIARKKAFSALRRATRGRRTGATDPDDPDDVTVVALDSTLIDVPDGSADSDPEIAFERTQQQLVLLRLARERLSGRERTVFFGIHFDGVTRAALAEAVGLTPQAVGQMYVRVATSLYAAARNEPSFPTTMTPPAPAPPAPPAPPAAPAAPAPAPAPAPRVPAPPSPARPKGGPRE